MAVSDLVVDDVVAINSGDDVQAGTPLAMWLQMHHDVEALLIIFHRSGCRDPGLSHILLATVAEHQSLWLNPHIVLALFCQSIFDLEKIGEVRSGIDAHVDVYR